jgi:ribosomal protein S27AE
MTRYYRIKAIEEKGYECENCGATEDIEVHHRDRNHCNNELDNLIVLCSDCHNTVHNGWPEKGSFLRELHIDTGVQLPEPVYKEAVAQSEQDDIQPGQVIRKWMETAQRAERKVEELQ